MFERLKAFVEYLAAQRDEALDDENGETNE
jgi:hypothetical protein